MSSRPNEAWPAASIAEVYRALTAPGMPFEMETRTIAGRNVRTYRHAFAHLRAVFEQGRQWGAREYLVFEEERLTFEAHYRAVAALARLLVNRYGIVKGDRIAIAMRNFPEWSVAFWASVVAGAVATPLNAWGTGDDLRYGITNAGCKLCFVDGERFERLAPLRATLGGAALIAVRMPREQAGGAALLEDLIGPVSAYGSIADDALPPVALSPEDDATIFYTSGTTGRPKGALGTHRNIITNIVHIDFSAAFMALRRGDPLPPAPGPQAPQKTVLLPAPFFHVTGCHSNLVPAMAKGRRIVLMYKWNAERALELIEREHITNTSGVPTMVWQLVESPDFAKHDLSSVEGVSYGGAAAAPELTKRVRRKFPDAVPRQAYGATETSSVTTSNCGEDFLRKPASVGLPAPACDVRIMREDGSEAPCGENGEIWICGPNVVKGYWNNPDATARAFAGGWYRTGDIGKVDEEGFVYVLDRIKDMVIRGGENIYCVEIEAALRSHDAVLDVAVVGVPDRVLGEEIAAIVQLKPGSAAREDDLRAHAGRVLAAHKRPKIIAIRDAEFPRNASGKTLKRLLREELVAAAAPTP